MKKVTPWVLFLLLSFCLAFDSEPLFYGEYKPIFMLRPDMESNVKLEGPKAIINPGKIYLKDHLIFINEKYRGIHVIDNTNPEDPGNFAFINIDGCIDMAIKGNTLFADNATDLLSVQLDENLTSIKVLDRVEGIFPEHSSPDGRNLTWTESRARPKDAILVRWDKR